MKLWRAGRSPDPPNLIGKSFDHFLARPEYPDPLKGEFGDLAAFRFWPQFAG